MIKPTIGRVVWFTPSRGTACSDFTHHSGDQPHAAMVVYVWSVNLVNLVVYDHDGKPHSRTSVPLVQEGEPKPDGGYYASWMPFQVGQAKLQDKVQAMAATS
jgi:hypothetical protein